jgi:hypothetical protein
VHSIEPQKLARRLVVSKKQIEALSSVASVNNMHKKIAMQLKIRSHPGPVHHVSKKIEKGILNGPSDFPAVCPAVEVSALHGEAASFLLPEQTTVGRKPCIEMH